MAEYNHYKIESKWQKVWAKKKAFETKDKSPKKKFYSLVEFPYPSGDGLHVGHPRPYIGMDVISHKKRGEGYNVLFPMGWDAFGLPTENYAIKTGISPEIVTKRNTDTFRKQIQSLGISFDWSREINTTDPKYYRWTQWIFLQLLKHDLAYKAKSVVNWCPKDKTVLANEEVIDGHCERCGTQVEKKEKEQWMLRITKYADRLDKDLDSVNYIEKVKIQQRNWIGKSEGAEVVFEVSKNPQTIKVFTTRPETIFGATFVVLAPEHELVKQLWLQIENKTEVESYIHSIKSKTEIDRSALGKEKTGVELIGIKAINPATKEKIAIWLGEHVLLTYGTGAIMSVPGHDERDYDFATKFRLPIKHVVSGGDANAVYSGDGKLINSGKFDGKDSEKIKKEITKFAGGKWVTKFKLRDWVFSRQRYWGEPIPVVHCAKCGIVPLSEKDLPLKLPKIDKYAPTDSGESPLATLDKWVNVKCPKCKGMAKRETDTMPNWAGSSWYFLRYIDPKNNKKFADYKKLKQFMPVDWYNGGMEHTTLHLLYSRFWNKFLYDIGVVPVSEPYQKRTSHGLILAKGGEKMSKSKGNVVNPDQIVFTYGADTLRMYEMFMGPFSEAIAWGEENILGVRRFIERVWRLQYRLNPKAKSTPQFEFILHKTIKKVSDDIEAMAFNTAVSSMMILVNEMEKQTEINQKDFEMFLKILSPFAPHIAEEIWSGLGFKSLIVLEKWPKADPRKMVELEVKIGIQINNRVRAECIIPTGSSEEEVVKLAREIPDVEKWLFAKEIKKVIYVKDKLLNLIVV